MTFENRKGDDSMKEFIEIGKTGKQVFMEDIRAAIGWASQEQLAQILSHLSFVARTSIISQMKFDPVLREEFKLGASDFQNFLFGFIEEHEFEGLPDEEFDKFQENPSLYRDYFRKRVIEEGLGYDIRKGK
jgi:hypothetical protein